MIVTSISPVLQTLHTCLVAQLCLTLCHTVDFSPPGSFVRGDSPGQNTRVGCHALLQGIFPTQAKNSGFPYWRWLLYHLSHQGSPRILEWVAIPFSRGSSQPRNQTGVSWIAGRFFTSWATREVWLSSYRRAFSGPRLSLCPCMCRIWGQKIGNAPGDMRREEEVEDKTEITSMETGS